MESLTAVSGHPGVLVNRLGQRLARNTEIFGRPGRVNVQNNKGTAKVYQVRQILKAIEKPEAQRERD